MSWRRARPVLLMTLRDLRRRKLRTVLVAVLLALVTAVGVATVTMVLGSRDFNASVSQDAWVSAATLLVCVLALGLVCLITAPLHLATARRQLRQIGLLQAAGGRERDAMFALVAPAGLTAGVGAVVGAPLGLLLSFEVMQSSGLVLAGAVLGAVAFGAVVIAANIAAALGTAWRVRDLPVVDRLGARMPEPPAASAIPRAALAIGLILAGGAAVVVGVPRADLLLVAGGALAAWAGLAAMLALGVTSILGRAARGPYSLRYALREGARHPLRVVPTTIASATMVALLVAAMAYVGSTHQAARDTFIPSGPPGSAVLMRQGGSDGVTVEIEPSDIDELSDMAAGAGSEGTAVPVDTPDRPLVLIQGEQRIPLSPADEGSLLGGTGMPNALVGTTELVDAWGYDADVQNALAAGHVVVAPDALPGGVAVVDGPGGESDVVVDAILPAGPMTALLPVSLVTSLGIDTHTAAALVVGLDPAALENLGQQVHPAGWLFAIEQGPPELEDAPTQYALLAAAAVMVALVLWIMGALAREEARSDVVTLEAVGARPRFTRWVAAWQAGGAATIAVLAGVPVGLLGTRLLMTVRDTSLQYVQTPLTIPWLPLLAMLVVVPLGAALGVAALQPRRPPLVRRLAD